MNPTPIDAILQHLASGSILSCVQGTLTKIYPMKAFGDPADPKYWTKQDGELRDAAGQTIKVEFRFAGNQVPDNWKNRSLTFQSQDTASHGKRGISVYDDSFNGKTTRLLRITNLAVVEVDGAASTQQAAAPTQQRQTPPQTQQTTASAQQQAPKQEPPPARSDVHYDQGPRPKSSEPLSLKRRLMKQATMWIESYRAAVAVAGVINRDQAFVMNPIGIASIATSFYIDAARNVPIGDVDEKSVDWSGVRGLTTGQLLALMTEQNARAKIAGLDCESTELQQRRAVVAAHSKTEVAAAPPVNFEPGPDDDEYPF